MSRYLKGRDYALKLVTTQLIVAVLVAVTASFLTYQIALSVFIGGIICVLANCWLALVVFRPQLGAPLGKMLAAFYVGEIGKFVITALLFLLAFKKLALFKDTGHALALLLGYVITQSVVWIYPLFKK
jgi:ATP synthase protein I